MVLKSLLLFCLCLLPLKAQSFLWFGTSKGWHTNKICAPDETCSSTKIFYCNPSPINGVTIELLYAQNSLNLVLGFLWCPLNGPTYDRYAEIVVTPSNGVPICFYPYCCIGNQKVIFCEEDTKALVDRLLEGESLTFSVGMYETQLPADGFILYWKQLPIF
jgi:hypothetical protein